MNISDLKEVTLREVILDMNPMNTGNKRRLDLKIGYSMSPSESKVTMVTLPLPLWGMANFLLELLECKDFTELRDCLENDVVTCEFVFANGKIAGFYNKETQKVYDIHYHRITTLNIIYQMYQ